MDQLLEFAGNHFILVTAFVVVASLLAQDLMVNGGKGSVDAKGATDLINNQNAVVIDVRPSSDFNNGHIINAKNIPMSSFNSQIDKLQKHKNKPIIISCRSGAQSASACRMLRKQGFENVFNLTGGILSWQSANFPISRKRK